MSFDLKKECEVCNTPIPDDFGNLLCTEHYNKEVKETEVKERQDEEMKTLENEKDPDLQKLRRDYVNEHPEELPQVEDRDYTPHSQEKDGSITEPNYKENPEQPDKNQVMTNLAQFVKTKQMLYHHSRSMYEFVKDYMIYKSQAHQQFSKHIWKPTVVDVGCGSGVGSNILSQEADFVWGIDKNNLSIEFAQQAFTREKNAMYYSSQATFDKIDIIKETRETMAFDIVVAIEIIEHINDYDVFLRKIISTFTKKNKNGSYANTVHHEKNGDFYDGTEFFISTPNRNHPKISNDTPKNIFHVREWTSGEFIAVLKKYFGGIELYDWKGNLIPQDQWETTTHSPILAKCKNPTV